jgi:hypothetical protein
MSRINDFCLLNNFRISGNPCISPDFCLDWGALQKQLRAGQAKCHPLSRFETKHGRWELAENTDGDCAWILSGDGAPLADGVKLGEREFGYPATWTNLLTLKNLTQEHDPRCTIFPAARGSLRHSSLGIGARFTTLHWPAVAWASAHLGLSLTANQNSIPRELVYDVDAMLDGELDRVPFPFIGASVPEGHQGQSVEGMSHGAVISFLKCGFHRRRIDWGFNADHQPIGGKFDAREDRLVSGSILASYITFDLSPELSLFRLADQECEPWCVQNVPADSIAALKARIAAAGIDIGQAEYFKVLAQLWPAVQKMKRRDGKYRQARERAFTTAIGRDFIRELSIDELPGLTTPGTLAVALALCEQFDMPVQFVAPAFGFQKNAHFDDNAELRRRVAAAWEVCTRFNVSIGFHSGSGKSPENYHVCGQITGGKLEIKTSGRYTFEMGAALSRSAEADDQKLWRDWHAFTCELASACAFSEDKAERDLARSFISNAIGDKAADAFSDIGNLRAVLKKIPPSANHMFWFEYNFLFVLAAHGSSQKSALGDHGLDGYCQRARFYAISDEARLRYAKNVAGYICFLAENTGLVDRKICEKAGLKLAAFRDYTDLLSDIAPAETSSAPTGRNN